ncbi:MAG: hypothetical protein QOJ34_2538 [Pseudonocardiales bacterium]|jgi:hypothetical protein|nr:hypothetical protein [Pseudonocardiales bacterium]
MRDLHMSTGAWIFTGLVTAAIVAPTAVYAAASSTVAIGNTGNGFTATVTNNHQLLTTTVAPNNVVRAYGASLNNCSAVYTPPAGKAIVVTSVTYDMFTSTAPGSRNFAYLTNGACTIPYDAVDTDLAHETETRTFPIGLPMASVGIFGQTPTGIAGAYITGYLIPATQLPAAAPATKLPTRLSTR